MFKTLYRLRIPPTPSLTILRGHQFDLDFEGVQHVDNFPTDQDRRELSRTLALLLRAGVELAHEVEPDDIEDAIADDSAGFRTAPLTTVAGLCDPDGTPLFASAAIAQGSADIPAAVERITRAAGVTARDIAVMPDPGAAGTSGSVRVRFGEWDVADIDYDFAGPEGTFELDLVAAALPVGATAATFPTPDGRDVTLFLPTSAPDDAVDELIDAIEAEFTS